MTGHKHAINCSYFDVCIEWGTGHLYLERGIRKDFVHERKLTWNGFLKMNRCLLCSKWGKTSWAKYAVRQWKRKENNKTSSGKYKYLIHELELRIDWSSEPKLGPRKSWIIYEIVFGFTLEMIGIHLWTK